MTTPPAHHLIGPRPRKHEHLLWRHEIGEDAFVRHVSLLRLLERAFLRGCAMRWYSLPETREATRKWEGQLLSWRMVMPPA